MNFILWLTGLFYFNSLFYLIGLGILLSVAYYFTSFPWLIWRLIGIPCAIFFILSAVVIIGDNYPSFLPDKFFTYSWVRAADLYGIIYLLSELVHWAIQINPPATTAGSTISGSMAIPLLWFAGIYIAYGIISQLLFMLTSGDASISAEIIYFLWIFPLYWLILLGSRFYRTEKLLEPYFWKLVIAILVLHVFTLLFNFHVCVSGGSYNFIQALIFRLAVGKYGNICTTSDKQVSEQLLEFIGTEPWIPLEIVFLARILYYILNLILILVR
jgi:hypothetical protein